MKRLIVLAAVAVAAVAMPGPAYAVAPGEQVTSTTTLVACGYFVAPRRQEGDRVHH